MRKYFAFQKILVVVSILTLALACAGSNPNPNVTPQAKLAHYGADVANGITTLQQTVTQVRAACSTCAAATDKITDIDQQAVNAVNRLSSALKTYDTATTLGDRGKAAADVQASVALVSQLLSQAFSVKIDNELANQVSQMISNVLALTATVSAEVAKGMGGVQ